MIRIPKELLNPDGTPSAQLLDVILKVFDQRRARLNELKSIYDRNHGIMRRMRPKGLPNTKLVHDLPGYIVKLTSGYLVGSPVTYAASDDAQNAFTPIVEALRAARSDSVDSELATSASIYGKGIELCYADEQARPRVAQLDVRDAFVVYDDTVEAKPLLGIAIRPKLDMQLKVKGQYISVYTATTCVEYERMGQSLPVHMGETNHYFGSVPLVEYWNNSDECGDFEPVQSLIDAYDSMQSDRVNDKQQFTDAILLLKGVGSLGMDDTQEIVYDDDGNAIEADDEQKEQTDPSVRLRQTRTLFLPGDGADAGFVTKPDAESGNELLRASLNSDIHKLALVPDLTDKDFAGNASGVAMKFKLFGLEQITKTKERWFREGLRNRLKLFMAFLSIKGGATMDIDAIQISFTRSLPVNDLEIAQTVSTYDGLVPKQMLLGQVPFVDDVDEAMDMLKQEQEEAIQRQQQAFEAQAFRGDREVGEADAGEETGKVDKSATDAPVEKKQERQKYKEDAKDKKRPLQRPSWSKKI